MIDVERPELVLLAMAGPGGKSPATADAVSMAKLVEVLGYAPARLSQQMALATTLETLVARELVEREDSEEGVAFRLTDEGAERAQTVFDRLATVEIEVIDDDVHTLPLVEAATELDRTIPQLVTKLTDDGQYYHGTPVERRIVGRERERERCRALLEDGRDADHGQALLVTGPGGIGKTTLASDVLETARTTSYTVAGARCQEATAGPYAPIRDLVAALDSQPPVTTGGLDVDDPEAFESGQAALFYQFTRALCPSPDEPPRVLHVDDLHLADSGTIAYLAHLGRQLDAHRIVLVLSYRPAEFAPGSAFEAAFADDREHVTALRLEPLDASATRTVIEQTTTHPGAPEPFVRAIHDRTGGNPLFVEGTVAALLAASELDPTYAWYPTAADDVDVPAGVRGTISSQVAALDEPAQELLHWAALVGPRVPLSVLERVVDHPAGQVGSHVEVLIEAGIFDRMRDPAVVGFRSEVVRDTLVETVPDRRDRHATIAAAFEAVSAGRDVDSVDGDSPEDESTEDAGWTPAAYEWASAIASHHERAGDVEAALEWYRRAGRRAMDAYANEIALDHYRHARTLANELDDEPAILTITERLATIYLLTGEFDRADRHVRYASQRATEPARRQRLAGLAARIARTRGDYEAAMTATSDGLAIETMPSSEYCDLLLVRADLEDHSGAFEEAIETAETARAIATEMDDQSYYVEATHRLGLIATKQDRLDDAQRELEEALELAEDMGNRHRAAGILLPLGSIAFKQGDLSTMGRHLQAALDYFEAVGDPHGAAFTRANLAIRDRKRGDFETATSRIERAIETLEALGDEHAAARQRGNLGSIALSQGEFDRAQILYERALAGFEAVGERREIAIARTGLGRIAIKQGRYDAAQEYLEASRDAFEEMEISGGAANAGLYLTIVDYERGRHESARVDLQTVIDSADAIGDPGLQLNAMLALASVDTVVESPARGLAWWDEIDGVFDLLDPSHSVEPFERILRACIDAGDHAIALEWCDRALGRLETVDANGLSRLRDFLDGQRRDLGATIERH